MVGSTVKVFFSCRVSALLVLSHFGWQLVGPIQHGTASFLASCHRGVNERLRQCRQTNVGLTKPKNRNRGYFCKTEPKTAVFCKTEPKTKPTSFFCQPHTPNIQEYKNRRQSMKLVNCFLSIIVIGQHSAVCSSYSEISYEIADRFVRL